MSYYGSVKPLKKLDLTDSAAYALAVDVQMAHTHLECRGCKTKMVEGEPMISLHIRGDYKLSWRRNYCGACAASQVSKMVITLQEAAQAIQDEIAKLGGDSYYVAKRVAGDSLKARKGMKAVLDELTKQEPSL